MILDYINEAMHTAIYEVLEDDGSFYGEIPSCRGVYANALSLESCRNELAGVLEEWLLIRIYRNLPIPEINGVTVEIKAVA
ncbi:Toxin-antitoxin system, antitoxin component, HicB family [Desulfamplus magnetovallimortis]|uniref:Toxin-antitoxin system, antitoxin component, HicB family n=1 Tax=Desulfamplus magnetovallimortis TaxID=1246637 RepID=A0A1W1H5F3_9BACT|nr:HicB family protein [Desulfamplus magnetovallimortis]SLM27677.1 Toxin-antitoxin system, antitoxin component, HicB family [Desulfamplus magnetovallimortis]